MILDYRVQHQMASSQKKKEKSTADTEPKASATPASEINETGETQPQKQPEPTPPEPKSSLFGWLTSSKKNKELTPEERELLAVDNRRKVLKQWREDSKNLDERMEILEKKMNTINLDIYRCLDLSGRKPVPIISKQGLIKRLRVKLNVCKHEHALLLHEYYETQLASTNARYSAIADPSKETYKEKLRASSSAVSVLKSKMTGNASEVFDNNVRVAELREEMGDSAAEFDSMLESQGIETGNDEDFFQSVVQCAQELQQKESISTPVTKKPVPIKQDVSSGEVKKAVKVKPRVNPNVDVEGAILSVKLDQIPPASQLPVPKVHNKSNKGNGGQASKVLASNKSQVQRSVVQEPPPISIVPKLPSSRKYQLDNT